MRRWTRDGFGDRAAYFVVLLALAAGYGVSCGGSGGSGGVSLVPTPALPKGEDGTGLALLTPDERALVLATIDGRPITLGEFQDRLDKQSPYIRARYNSIERKKEFLDNLIRFELLAMAAEKKGYATDPDVIRAMKQTMTQKLMKDEFDATMKLEDITEEEMKKYYDEHKDEFHKPAQVRVSVIVVKDKAAADAALAEVTAAGTDHKKWRDLVTKYSVDEETKARGGDLRYFAKPEEGGTGVEPKVAEVAFALDKVGDVGPVVETPKGFYIIKLTGKRKELHRTFEQVKRSIAQRLFREKRTKAFEDYVASLKAAAKIEIFPEHLEKVKIVLGKDAAGVTGTGGPGMDVTGTGMPGMDGTGTGGAGAPPPDIDLEEPGDEGPEGVPPSPMPGMPKLATGVPLAPPSTAMAPGASAHPATGAAPAPSASAHPATAAPAHAKSARPATAH
ncbi:MAG TPA: peptidyl-prolyl cis-trans isomerase [Myxococcota bacterium]|jgi:peptidyl-prolyl cis-trans isomerase C|nr:peptidyl-prolyl cis-trans isomerase [Myxococcota bacterium]